MSIPALPVEADEEDSLLTRKLQEKSTASLLPNLPSSFTASPHTAQLHRVVVVVELCLFCRRGAAQLAGRRPKLPRPLRPTLRKRSHNKEVQLAPPTHPARTPSLRGRDRAPWGPCRSVQGPPWSRESRSCGRAAYSREIVHFVRPKSAQSFLLQLEFGGSGLETAAPARLPLQTTLCPDWVPPKPKLKLKICRR